MKTRNKKIIDERQERQSLQNSSIVCTVMIIMLCVLFMIQTLLLQRGFSYYGPEFITLMAGSLLKLILDMRQGNVYTATNAKTRKTILLYVLAALIFAAVIGIRNYLLYDFELYKITYIIIPIFIEMLILFLAVHFAFLGISKKRLEKLEKELEKDEFEE